MPDILGFQYRGILNLYRIFFHAVVVFGPEHDFLFKSSSAYCGWQHLKLRRLWGFHFIAQFDGSPCFNNILNQRDKKKS